MEIITINVGQGAFAVVRDDDEAVIVDTRIPAAGDDSAEFVKRALSKCVANRNVRGLVLTGFDNDHADASGVAIVLRKYRPDWIMYPKYYKPSSEARAVFGIINGEEEARRGSASPLTKYSVRLDLVDHRFYKVGKLCTRMSFETFSPHPEDMESSNDSSLVVKISHPSLTYLVTGDAELTRWETIARLFGSSLKSDVMAAPHHGSKNGAHAGALKHIKPHTVLISAGPGNSYGHPHAEALKVFRTHATEIHSTHEGESLHTHRRADGRIRTDRGSIT